MAKIEQVHLYKTRCCYCTAKKQKQKRPIWQPFSQEAQHNNMETVEIPTRSQTQTLKFSLAAIVSNILCVALSPLQCVNKSLFVSFGTKLTIQSFLMLMSRCACIYKTILERCC